MTQQSLSSELNLNSVIKLLARSGLTPEPPPGSTDYIQSVIDGLVELCAVDPCTGLGTKRRLQEELSRYRGLVIRGMEVSVIVIKIDGVDKMDDPSKTDRPLRTAAGVLRASIRDADIPGRLHDDVFAIVLPDTSMSTARIVIGRVRQNLMETYFGESNGVITTVSFGLAMLGAGETASSCYSRAEMCLYMSDHAGLNTVVSADTSM